MPSADMMWNLRLLLVAVLGAIVAVDWFLIKRRQEYGRLLENRFLNTLLVLSYQLCCYLIVVLPTAEWRVPFLGKMAYHRTSIGLLLLGGLLACAGWILQMSALVKRKALGLQDVKQGLITSGPYQYFRHPIYVGTIWVCLGLALLLRNPDGLLTSPAIAITVILAAVNEERNDMMKRFPDAYRRYRQCVGMLGPPWLWAMLLVAVLFLVYSAPH